MRVLHDSLVLQFGVVVVELAPFENQAYVSGVVSLLLLNRSLQVHHSAAVIHAMDGDRSAFGCLDEN